MTDKILNIKQAAQLLHMHPSTLSERARTGAVPATRWGRRWLFSQALLLEFIETQSLKNCAFERIGRNRSQTSTNAKIPPSGGTNSRLSVVRLNHYAAALKPPTSAKRGS